MSETENKYVKRITDADKQKIINSSVAALPDRPTINATEMKKRFVEPIVKSDSHFHCLADEVDRIANEADQAFHNVASSIADLQGMDGAIDETARTALEKANKAEEDINKAKEDILQLQIDFGGLSGLNGALSDLEDKVAYAKASRIEASVHPLTFVTTFKLLGDDGYVISTAEIDLPLESMIVDVSYNKDVKSFVFKLKSGGVVLVPLQDVFEGFVSSAEKGAPNGVASLDENGKIPKEQLGIASTSEFGVVKINNAYGVRINNLGELVLDFSNDNEIANQADVNTPIRPKQLPQAVKSALVKHDKVTLTDKEKESACEWIGAATPKYVDDAIANAGGGSSGGGTKLYLHSLKLNLMNAEGVYSEGNVTVQTTIGESAPGSTMEGRDTIFKKMAEIGELYRFAGANIYGADFDDYIIGSETYVIQFCVFMEEAVCLYGFNVNGGEDAIFLCTEVLEDIVEGEV